MSSPRRTRAANASKRPGLAVKSMTRRTSAEVKAEADAKVAAKAAKKEAQQARIKRVAEFETEAMANEDLIDATPRPNFASKSDTHVSHLESEDLGTSEVDGPNPDGHMYVPDKSDTDGGSDDSARPAEMTPIPKVKKIRAPVVATTKVPKPDGAGKSGSKASKQLATITENSEGDSESRPSKESRVVLRKRGMIIEDTDSDGIELPSRGRKSKGKAKAKAKAKATAKAKAKATAAKNGEVTTAESDMDLPPLPKKAKVAKKDRGPDGGKKKEGVREAIAAIQQEQPVAVTEVDNGSGASGEWGWVAEVRDTAPGEVKDVPKRFGDGPQWNRQVEGNGDKGRTKVVPDQTIANCGPVAVGKRPNQNMTRDDMDHDTMYVTYSDSLIMLTLDPTTLFYWTISDPPPKKMKYSVESWAKSIPSNAKPASRAPSQANSAMTRKSSGSNRYGSTAPTLTSATSRSAASSILTSAITITSAHVPVKIKQDPDSIYAYDGGISDCEETAGVERNAAHASPIKGKKRLTSEALVTENKSKPVDANVKKFKNEHLPREVDRQVWRRNFVPTFMMFIARQDNPFEHNVKVVSVAMQKIWDVLFCDVPHTIVHSSPVYQLTMQRVSDSWRNTIGSTAIAVVLAFCNANPDLKNSNEDRRAFASEYLEDLRFLYRKSDGDDVNKFKGAFRGPFILQTFASHLTAVKGAQKIQGLEDSRPYGGLAIATAAVERALKLIASGTLTVEMVKNSKGRVPTIPKQMNQATGKASNQVTGFNEASWGVRCSAYVKSAKKLSASRFDEILSLATEYMKAGPNHEDDDIIEIVDDDDDIRANIVDHSSSSSEGDCADVMSNPSKLRNILDGLLDFFLPYYRPYLYAYITYDFPYDLKCRLDYDLYNT